MSFEQQQKPQALPDEVLEKTNSSTPENFAFDLATLRIDLNQNLATSYASAISLDRNKDRKLNQQEISKSLAEIAEYDRKIDYLFNFLIKYFAQNPDDFTRLHNVENYEKIDQVTGKKLNFQYNPNSLGGREFTFFSINCKTSDSKIYKQPKSDNKILEFSRLTCYDNGYFENFKSMEYKASINGEKYYNFRDVASFRSKDNEYTLFSHNSIYYNELIPPFMDKENISKSYYEIMLKAIQIHLLLYPEI